MKSTKVLLLDDDDMSNIIVEQMMRKIPQVETFHIETNNLDAIKHLKTGGNFPKRIIVDLEKHEEEGSDFIEYFHVHFYEGHPHTGIIVLVDPIKAKDRFGVFKYPCVVRFENKPIMEEKLFEIIGI